MSGIIFLEVLILLVVLLGSGLLEVLILLLVLGGLLVVKDSISW